MQVRSKTTKMSYYMLPSNPNGFPNGFSDRMQQLQQRPDTNNRIRISNSLVSNYAALHAQLIDVLMRYRSATHADIDFKCANTVQLFGSFINHHSPSKGGFPADNVEVNDLTNEMSMLLTYELFYDLIEIIYTMNLMHEFEHLPAIRAVHIGNKSVNNYQYLRYVRNNISDKYFYFNEDIGPLVGVDYTFNYIFYDIDTASMTMDFTAVDTIKDQLTKCIAFLLQSQMIDGICIIKCSYTVHKDIIGLMYMLTALYKSVYIIKPSTSNSILFDKYIVCKGFIGGGGGGGVGEHRQMSMDINVNVPLIFLNKLNEINIIYGHKQIEAMTDMVFILKNKHYDDRVASICQSNMNKYINWCKKYNIPYYSGSGNNNGIINI